MNMKIVQNSAQDVYIQDCLAKKCKKSAKAANTAKAKCKYSKRPTDPTYLYIFMNYGQTIFNSHMHCFLFILVKFVSATY